MLAALIVSGRVEMNCLAHNGKTGVRIIVCLLVLLVIVPVHGRAGAQQLSIREIRRIGPAYGGHGGMWADTDGDGLPDLYMTYNGSSGLVPDFYFHNNGNETFQDQTQVSGLDDTDGGSHGACWADLDNDGDYDLINATTYVVSSFSNTNDLFENLGNGQFVRIQGTPLDSRHEKTRAILAFDMDGDGDLDIFAVNGYRGSDSHENNEVYRNDGDFRFTQITSGALYGCPAGQGATDTDFDGDGDVDIIAANRTGKVNILKNDGHGNFTRVDPVSVGINHKAGDGITTADIDNDGDLDLLLVTAGSSELYRNNGGGHFSYLAHFNDKGYMGGFADLDNDGDLDLVFAGGSHVYLNNGHGGFYKGPAIPDANQSDPRSIAFADINNNGQEDFIRVSKGSENRIYAADNPSGNWLELDLISENGQIGAFGAKVYVYSIDQNGESDQLIGFREVNSNQGYLAENSPRLHFGLGTAGRVNVRVHFLSGTEVIRKQVEANYAYTIDGRNTQLIPGIMLLLSQN